MGSLIDLNLYPDPIAAGGATTSAAAAPLVPKIEPKTEPFDGPVGFSPQPQFLIRNPNSDLPDPPETPISDANNLDSGVAAAGVREEDENNDLYSEFYRVSEMFRSAFTPKVEVDDAGDSRAIVPVPEDHNQLSAAVQRPRHLPRSNELVRYTKITPEDHRNHRVTVRKTRMIYDSLRILLASQEEQRRATGQGYMARLRGDLRAAAAMKDRGFWLFRDKRIVGELPGIYIGDVFFFRMELCAVGLHGQPQAGIDYLTASQSPIKEPIATSVIVSGGYEDNEDAGDVILYTGHGGQDKNGRQVENQKLESGNLAMEKSMVYGVEVRVVRGIKYAGSVSGKVYVYDGLYRIVNYGVDVGRSGFGVFKFKLVRIENQPDMGTAILRYAENLRTRPLEVRPHGYVNMDISGKKERMPVHLFNDIDDNQEPAYFDYLPTTVFPPYVYHIGGKSIGCNCVSGCSDGCVCALKNGGELPYDINGHLIRGKPLIFECGPQCRCPPGCRNRVSQHGVRNRFEIFRSRETGWGVRSLDLIQAGSFVCEYTGVVLTKQQAQLFSMSGDTLIYPNRFGGRWAEWGDLSQIFNDYVPPTYPSVPPLEFAMDVSRLRNLACYISHSSSPNVLVQLVLFDHNNVLFPHLMLFAMENIPPLRELSLDYGVPEEWTGQLSICN